MTEEEKKEHRRRDAVMMYSAWCWLVGFHQGVTNDDTLPRHLGPADEAMRVLVGKALSEGGDK